MLESCRCDCMAAQRHHSRKDVDQYVLRSYGSEAGQCSPQEGGWASCRKMDDLGFRHISIQGGYRKARSYIRIYPRLLQPSHHEYEAETDRRYISSPRSPRFL